MRSRQEQATQEAAVGGCDGTWRVLQKRPMRASRLGRSMGTIFGQAPRAPTSTLDRFRSSILPDPLHPHRCIPMNPSCCFRSWASFLLILFPAFASFAPAAHPSRPPNIVFILADDLGTFE